jgi:hypothetical protein
MDAESGAKSASVSPPIKLAPLLDGHAHHVFSDAAGGSGGSGSGMAAGEEETRLPGLSEIVGR